MSGLQNTQKQNNAQQDVFIIKKNHRNKGQKKQRLHPYLYDSKLQTYQKPCPTETLSKSSLHKPPKVNPLQTNSKQVTNLHQTQQKMFPLIEQKYEQKNGQLFEQSEEILNHVIPFQEDHDFDILYNVSSHDGCYDPLELALFGYPRTDTQLQNL